MNPSRSVSPPARRRVRCGTLLCLAALLPGAAAAQEIDVQCTITADRGGNSDRIGKTFDVAVNADGSVSTDGMTYSNRTENNAVQYRAEVTANYISWGISRAGLNIDWTVNRVTGNFVTEVTGSFDGKKLNTGNSGTCRKLDIPRKF